MVPYHEHVFVFIEFQLILFLCLKISKQISYLKFASLIIMMMMRVKWLLFKKQVKVSVYRKKKHKEHTTKIIDI